jgi:hypothetical protein
LDDPAQQVRHGLSSEFDAPTVPLSRARASNATPPHARLALLQCIVETAPEALMAKVLT